MTSFPSDRFAAYLAHSLTSDERSTFFVDAGLLYVSVLDALARRYRLSLLSHASFAARMTGEEAAQRYFDVTLARPLWLSNRVEVSLSHRILLVMCRRGVLALSKHAELIREEAAAASAAAVRPLMAVPDLDHVSLALARLPQRMSSGNPANAIRQRKGPLWLVMGPSRIEVPEEMSIWSAICAGPQQIRSLAPGEEFNRFCGILIDALRTAHRPFQELVGLGRGLCPFDWLEALSINQVRGLRQFLRKLSGADTIEAWSVAWDRAPVPGFKTFRDLWNSEIGRALRSREVGFRDVPIDSVEDVDLPAPDVLSKMEFEQRLRALRRAGVIEEVECIMLNRLYCGETLSDLAANSDVAALLTRRGLNFPVFLSDLQERVENWQRMELGSNG
ncbi:hypothetical protein [Bradyrhizobium sp. 21]|uniref:hypothetical protein n=1 Tax=Bradyrhizobium sp. 21 TaxID=2782666 RepID=UPI001FFA0BA1|nr:hypothetical protein [Bradyrhizobium sp. 21]MCK1389021.1 hypothetical protein [Bradyrhizobium sp. 21]